MADGVSACKNSRIGAEIACKVCADILLDHVSYYFDSDIEKIKNIFLDNIRSEIKKRAEIDNCSPEDYSSTLSFLCYDKLENRYLTFSLGDSRIYRITNNEVSQINRTRCHEHNLVCSTMSYNADKEIVIQRGSRQANEKYLLCTDGMWKTTESDLLQGASEIIKNGDSLARMLNQQTINDDCSFILTD